MITTLKKLKLINYFTESFDDLQTATVRIQSLCKRVKIKVFDVNGCSLSGLSMIAFVGNKY